MRIITPARTAGIVTTREHNLGSYNLGGHPAGFTQGGGRFPRNVGGNTGPRAGGFRGHNVGAQTTDMARQVASIMAGFGAGYDNCGVTPPPQIATGPDGCPEGWNQCKQDLAVDSGGTLVAAAATVIITVTPRRVFTPYYFIYPGALLTFTIDKVEVDGVNYLGSDVPILADNYQPIVTDLSVQWGQFSSTTPLKVTVTNISIADARFRGALKGVASRG